MAINFFDNLSIGTAKALDDRYLNNGVPYASTTAANTAIIPTRRHLGLKVMIGASVASAVEYAYQGGIADVNLLPATSANAALTIPTGDPNSSGILEIITITGITSPADSNPIDLNWNGAEWADVSEDGFWVLEERSGPIWRLSYSTLPELDVTYQAEAPKVGESPVGAAFELPTVGTGTPTVSGIASDGISGTHHGQLLQVLDTGAWYKWDSVNELWVAEAVASTTSAIVTALGIPTYADLAAANDPTTGVGIGKPYYDTALSALNIATA